MPLLTRLLVLPLLALQYEDAVAAAAVDVEDWPGASEVLEVDKEDYFEENMSGLYYQYNRSAHHPHMETDLVWSVRNKPAALFLLQYDPTDHTWGAASDQGWSASGKRLRYPDGTGDPDCEDLTKEDDPNSPFVYICTEQDNEQKQSRLSVLQFEADMISNATTLIATREWDLTADLPAVDHNEGLEAITWVPDAFLVAHGLLDVSQGGTLYDPEQYPNHGSGLFFVGLESNGEIYAYALIHDSTTDAASSSSSSYTRVTSFSSGLDSIMALHFEDLSSSAGGTEGYLWAVCDDTCKGHSTVFSLTIKGPGTFQAIASYKRPDGMPNLNNEGFTSVPEAYCDPVTGLKSVLWCDDSADNGHVLRKGSIPCGAFVTCNN